MNIHVANGHLVLKAYQMLYHLCDDDYRHRWIMAI